MRTGVGGVSRRAPSAGTQRVWIIHLGSAVVPVGLKPGVALGVRGEGKEEERCWT